MSGIEWHQENVAGVALKRHVGRVGTIEVATIMYDGSNKFWVWSSPLADDAWGYGPSEDAAKRGFEVWLREWLENFRSFLAGEP